MFIDIFNVKKVKNMSAKNCGANPQRIARVNELRRSNASGSHDSRPNRLRTRSTAKRAAIKESFESR